MRRGDEKLVFDPGKRMLMDSLVLVRIQLPQPNSKVKNEKEQIGRYWVHGLNAMLSECCS